MYRKRLSDLRMSILKIKCKNNTVLHTSVLHIFIQYFFVQKIKSESKLELISKAKFLIYI